MRWTRHALATGGLAALLALIGCGGTPKTEQVSAGREESSPEAALDAGAGTDYPTQAKKACDVLTRDVARSVLGSVGEEPPPAPATSTEDLTVTSCVHANPAASLKTPRSVSLLMRGATSVTGAKSNESVFVSGSLPSGAQEVTGYGQAAFWNPAFGQLNILKDGNWYILAAGPIDPGKHTLAETKTLADAIVDQL